MEHFKKLLRDFQHTLTVSLCKKFITSLTFLDYHQLPCDEFLMYESVHDEVKVSLPESGLFVLETKMKVRQHV